ncbi:MAG TPA: MFS transporter [Acidimicrobiales bacterium]|nr:MFS transporter [Acidimicrobiales bacterium]
MPDASALSSPTPAGPGVIERTGLRRGMVLGLACVGQFMVVLDLSIVTVALPSMQRDLGFSTSQLQWVVNAYALTFGGFLLLGGRAADLFGRRRIFVLGLALFACASLVCAVAQDQQMLVGARALQGLGAAVLSPATLTILTTTFRDPRERARALGIWSAMAAIGGASGALLGGVLTDLLSWRWIFYVNLPIALGAILAARVYLSETRADTQRRHLDVLGSLTVTGSMVALVYAVAGTDVHPWSSTSTVVPLAIAATGLVLFALVETRVAAAPLVPFGIFRSRALSAANLTIMFVAGAMFTMWLFLSLYLQDVLHYSALVTGLGFVPQTAAIAVGAQISARIVPRLGPRLPLLVGTSITTVGLLWLSRVTPTGTYASEVLGGSVLATFGMGLSFTPLAFTATAGVRPQDAGLASGLLNTSRQVGSAVCLAILATIAAARTRALLAGNAHSAVHEASALTSGFARVFLIAAAIAAAGALCALAIPRSVRQERAEVAAGGPEPNAVAASEGHDALALEAEG